MVGTHVALIRGINVGRAKRVAMADLIAIVGDLGYSEVHSLLNSGNVVFTSAGETDGASAAARIEEALADRLGISAAVTVLSATELNAVVAGNPLVGIAVNPSRLIVVFLFDPQDLQRLEPLAQQDWAPEAVALGVQVAYLWCPQGVLASRVLDAVGRVLGEALTTRNWRTVTKLHKLTERRTS